MPKARRGRKPKSETTQADLAQMPVPAPPKDLGSYGQDYWREHAGLLVELGILRPLHIQTFRVLCEQWQTYRKLSLWLDEDPSRMTFVSATGYEGETPQSRQRDKALDTLQKLWLKFGLTPHALATLNKQRGQSNQQQTPAIAEFAKKKYKE